MRHKLILHTLSPGRTLLDQLHEDRNARAKLLSLLVRLDIWYPKEPYDPFEIGIILYDHPMWNYIP